MLRPVCELYPMERGREGPVCTLNADVKWTNLLKVKLQPFRLLKPEQKQASTHQKT